MWSSYWFEWANRQCIYKSSWTWRVNGQVLPDIQKDGRTLIFLHHQSFKMFGNPLVSQHKTLASSALLWEPRVAHRINTIFTLTAAVYEFWSDFRWQRLKVNGYLKWHLITTNLVSLKIQQTKRCQRWLENLEPNWEFISKQTLLATETQHTTNKEKHYYYYL